MQATDSFEAHLLGGPIGEHRQLAATASPVTHVHAGAPPFLLQHGEADTWVPCDQSVRFAERLRSAGVTVELEVVPGADHFFDGAPDVEAIFERAVHFLLALDPGFVGELVGGLVALPRSIGTRPRTSGNGTQASMATAHRRLGADNRAPG